MPLEEEEKVTHKSVSTIGHHLPLPRDRPPKEKAQGMVYRISCAECDASYLGETKNFPKPLRRHMYAVINSKDIQGNVLAEHAEKTGHAIAFTAVPSSTEKESGGNGAY